MSIDVLPELALDGAESVRRALAAPERPGLAGALGAIVREAMLMLDFIAGYKAELDGRLRAGAVEASQLRAACEASLHVVDTLAGGVSELRDAAARHCGRENPAAASAEIDRLERQAAELRPAFAAWLDFVNRPAPPIDRERFDQGVAEAAAGRAIRYDSAADVLRDLAGG